MSYAIVFSSKTGNTKLLADTLHACLPQENCCYFGTPDPAAMEADDLYVGFWTDKGNADESTLDFLKQLHGKNIFLFGTAGFGGSEEYFNKILKKVERSLDRSNTVFGRYMCQGKMPLSVRQRYEGMKKQPIHLPNLDALIENFDKALSHPDADDLARLKQGILAVDDLAAGGYAEGMWESAADEQYRVLPGTRSRSPKVHTHIPGSMAKSHSRSI